jgi:hypothetical protein
MEKYAQTTSVATRFLRHGQGKEIEPVSLMADAAVSASAYGAFDFRLFGTTFTDQAVDIGFESMPAFRTQRVVFFL